MKEYKAKALEDRAEEPSSSDASVNSPVSADTPSASVFRETDVDSLLWSME